MMGDFREAEDYQLPDINTKPAGAALTLSGQLRVSQSAHHQFRKLHCPGPRSGIISLHAFPHQTSFRVRE